MFLRIYIGGILDWKRFKGVGLSLGGGELKRGEVGFGGKRKNEKNLGI